MLQAVKERTPRVLLVAEHASAVFGGEALIPFQYFKHLRGMDIDVHLLVHARTQKELEAAFSEQNNRLHFVADSFINVWCSKLGRAMPARLADFTSGVLSHLDTQVRQRRLARSLVRMLRIDVIHEPIPVSPKIPSMMFGLSVPVVMGPMNGGMDYPPNYNLAGGLERLVIFILRATSAFWNWVLPGKRLAALLLVANRRTYEALPRGLRGARVLELVENGVDVEVFKPAVVDDQEDRDEMLRVVYVGRLVDWKRVDLLISACARLVGRENSELKFELDIVGDGPLRGQLETQVNDLSLTRYVRFHGRLTHSETAILLRSAHVMALPSMRECGGAVVLEAMASGVPVIAAHWGGPTDYVTPETGILIPPATPNEFIQALAAAIVSMAKDPSKRRKMDKLLGGAPSNFMTGGSKLAL